MNHYLTLIRIHFEFYFRNILIQLYPFDLNSIFFANIDVVASPILLPKEYADACNTKALLHSPTALKNKLCRPL